ncbi:MAG: ScpA family protein [Patescibacteria group bacterium]
MPVTIATEKFSGPLDLLLSLIQEEKLTVSDIALSQVTEQFLRYLDNLEERRADELADFLVVAARLLLLKSRQLLPQFAPVEDEGPSLEDQLRLYKIFVDASKKFNRLWQSDEKSVFRIEPARKPLSFVPPTNVSLETLRSAMLQLVTRLTPQSPLPQTSIDKAVSLKQKIDQIRAILSRAREVNFHTLLSDAKNKTEVIVSFLAILELVKQKIVALKQGEGFGDILVERI